MARKAGHQGAGQREAGEGKKSAGRCPICREPTEAAYRPFCSARCRDVDLSRWLRGSYAIPGGQAGADEDGDDAAAAQAAAGRNADSAEKDEEQD
jgi:endogenous inhibitor of DNA gyrase (YacG/DUF329 family)